MKSKNILESFKHSFDGILYALKTERNLRFDFTMMFLVIIFGFLLKISLIEWMICLVCFGNVIGAELMNTAFENVVDICMPKINEKAKIAKDVSAGVVMMLSIFSTITGLIIFVPKLIVFFF